MKRIFSGKQKGMTLIEILIYLGLFAIIFSAAIEFSFVIGRQLQRHSQIQQVNGTVIFINNQINDTFLYSKQINTGNSTFDNVIGAVEVQSYSNEISRYYVNNGTLFVNQDGVVSPLTDQNLEVKEFTVTQILDKSSEIVGVRTTFKLQFYNSDVFQTIDTNFLLSKN